MSNTSPALPLGLAITGKRNDILDTGPFCSWFTPASTAKIAVAYITKVHNGLSDVYQNAKP